MALIFYAENVSKYNWGWRVLHFLFYTDNACCYSTLLLLAGSSTFTLHLVSFWAPVDVFDTTACMLIRMGIEKWLERLVPITRTISVIWNMLGFLIGDIFMSHLKPVLPSTNYTVRKAVCNGSLVKIRGVEALPLITQTPLFFKKHWEILSWVTLKVKRALMSLELIQFLNLSEIKQCHSNERKNEYLATCRVSNGFLIIQSEWMSPWLTTTVFNIYIPSSGMFRNWLKKKAMFRNYSGILSSKML